MLLTPMEIPDWRCAPGFRIDTEKHHLQFDVERPAATGPCMSHGMDCRSREHAPAEKQIIESLGSEPQWIAYRIVARHGNEPRIMQARVLLQVLTYFP